MRRTISFKATRARTLDDLPRREGQWTTNGMWLMRTLDEPRWMQELKSYELAAPLNTDKLVKKWAKQLTNAHELFSENLYTIDDVIARKYSTRERAFNVWLNVYYVSLYKPFFKLYGTGELQPVFVCTGDDKKRNLVGVIMPIRRSV